MGSVSLDAADSVCRTCSYSVNGISDGEEPTDFDAS